MSITISRHAGDGEVEFFIADPDDPGPFPRGTFDRDEAREFRDLVEVREWFESLSPTGRFVLFAACAYHVNDQSDEPAGLQLDEESAARLDEANPPFGSGRY